MLYPTCPRCQFRLPAGSHICRTCGYVLPKENKPEQAAAKQAHPRKAWNNVFNFGSRSEKHHDERALGET
jgi:hypothetical protein